VGVGKTLLTRSVCTLPSCLDEEIVVIIIVFLVVYILIVLCVIVVSFKFRVLLDNFNSLARSDVELTELAERRRIKDRRTLFFYVRVLFIAAIVLNSMSLGAVFWLLR